MDGTGPCRSDKRNQAGLLKTRPPAVRPNAPPLPPSPQRTAPERGWMVRCRSEISARLAACAWPIYTRASRFGVRGLCVSVPITRTFVLVRIPSAVRENLHSHTNTPTSVQPR